MKEKKLLFSKRERSVLYFDDLFLKFVTYGIELVVRTLGENTVQAYTMEFVIGIIWQLIIQNTALPSCIWLITWLVSEVCEITINISFEKDKCIESFSFEVVLSTYPTLVLLQFFVALHSSWALTPSLCWCVLLWSMCSRKLRDTSDLAFPFSLLLLCLASKNSFFHDDSVRTNCS